MCLSVPLVLQLLGEGTCPPCTPVIYEHGQLTPRARASTVYVTDHGRHHGMVLLQRP